MPKALIILTVFIFALGVWLVVEQGVDFDRFGRQRQRKLATQDEDRAGRRTVEIHGRFLDDAKRPIAGLMVELGRLGAKPADQDFLAVDRSMTDDKGRFEFMVESPEPRLLRVFMIDGEIRYFPDLPPSTPLELQIDSVPR